MLVVVDNRDSFTFNLVQALHASQSRARDGTDGTEGADENQAAGSLEVRVVRASEHDAAAILALAPAAILVGPGPGAPAAATTSLALMHDAGSTPVLGVCLGHQALGLAFGATIRRAPELVHGRAVAVEHDGRGVFEGVPSPARFTRYNSLTVAPEDLPDCLEITARTADGDVMGLRHRTLPLEGVQFHPESILSEHGVRLLENFVRRARVARV